MSSTPPVVLLTGATGLVGSGLLKFLLLAQPERRVVALVRRRDSLPASLRRESVTLIEGNVTRPWLGLDRPSLLGLKAAVSEIIHCAADTRFGLGLDQARATNTLGTANLLRVAEECPRLTKFTHLSTAYVAGRLQGTILEAPLVHAAGFCNTYQESKYEAEQLVVEAMKKIPAAIFRLSTIFGDAATGQVRQFNYVHRLLKLLPRNLLPIAPGDPAARIDLIPSDWALPALARVHEEGFVPGRVYHVCAGPEGSLSVPELGELTLRAYEAHPLGQRWLPIRLPVLVSLAEYEEFVKTRQRGSNPLLKELSRALGHFLPHLAMVQFFDNRNLTEALVQSDLRLPSIREYYEKVLSYCLESDWHTSLGSE